MESGRVIIEVVAGLIPGGDPDPEFTKRWAITSREWEEAGDKSPMLLAERNGAACGYAQLLMALPNRLNWVRVDWIWL